VSIDQFWRINDDKVARRMDDSVVCLIWRCRDADFDGRKEGLSALCQQSQVQQVAMWNRDIQGQGFRSSKQSLEESVVRCNEGHAGRS
jgi:hypothetical protein